MFRCVTELKGLIIDIDSFEQNDLSEWSEFVEKYKCLFLTSSSEIEDRIFEQVGQQLVYGIEIFEKLFAPSISTHKKSLEILGLKPTEVAYVSADLDFLKNAMGFLGGAIWVSEDIDYQKLSSSPDLVCKSIANLEENLSSDILGFFGEIRIYPARNNRGKVIPFQFEVDDELTHLYMLGRYFGYDHYMNQLHPYSSAIFLNKREGKPYYGKFDKNFADLYAKTVGRIQRDNVINGICSVPVRPGEKNRFKSILEIVAEECNINNYEDNFSCVKNYQKQKMLSSVERRVNVEGVFEYTGDLSGQNIVLIDDIATTGATIKSCIKELRDKGVNQIHIVVLAVNQFPPISYWSSVDPIVSCPQCDYKMTLLVNGSSGSFFYSCYNCHNTLNYQDGRKILEDRVNGEMD